VARHAAWLRRRFPSVLADPLSDVHPDIVREVLVTVPGTPSLDLSEWEWRHLAGASAGVAIYDTAPRPFRRIAFRHLVDPDDSDALDAREERLLVLKALQGRPWESVAEELDYHSTAECMRALGRLTGRLVDLYGSETTRAERRRFE
jgi:tRNA(Met) cytidine acetyltransferase